jgi:hypothetical protein
VLQTVELAARITRTFDHRAGPETTLAVDAAVIETHVRRLVPGALDPRQIARLGMIERKSRLERRDDFVAAVDEAERSQPFRKFEALQRACGS